MILSNQSHRSVQAVNSVGANLYLSQTTLNPVQLGSDDGTYSCEVIINAMDEFVLSTTAVSNAIAISATGKYSRTPCLNLLTILCLSNLQPPL